MKNSLNSHKPLATAIKYSDDCNRAGTIAAQGDNQYAMLIERAARRYGIPIVFKKELAQELASLRPSQTIPNKLYKQIMEAVVPLICSQKTDTVFSVKRGIMSSENVYK